MKGLSLQLGPYRFAPALWPSVAFAALFPLLLSLGAWQMHRAVEKEALVEQRAAGEVAAPLQLQGGRHLRDDERFRQAVARGRYVEGQQWLLDNRVYRGQAGYHVFTPFRLDGDDRPALLVNRGWVAVGASREFLPALPLPTESVSLRGRLDAPASVGLVVGEVPLHSIADKVVVQSLDVAALAAARDLPLLRYALVIDDGQPGGLQHDWSPIPQMGPEKHLGYAVQWFGLAVALLIIFVGVNTRRGDRSGGKHARA
jgi:surfeit locus 1 family protein